MKVRCIKDYCMTTGEVAFKAGKTYSTCIKLSGNWVFVDEQGDQHHMSDYHLFSQNGGHFVKVEQPFDGDTASPEVDNSRLSKQINRVYDTMSDGKWRTVGCIAELTGDPQASVSARLRDLRKDKHGGHTVERERLKGGLYQYRLLVNTPCDGWRERQVKPTTP